jgi:hypothetical protein
VNVDEVVAQRDDEHKARGKGHRDQDQPPVLPGDLSESVHGWGHCNPITASLISETSAQPSSICGFCPEKFEQLVRPMVAARYSAQDVLPPGIKGLLGDRTSSVDPLSDDCHIARCQRERSVH